jgi:ATP-dependent Clp protease ATP-binding subunit ClpC
MVERFNERSCRVFVLAQDEARHFGHNFIGGVHLLLGPREEVGVAAQVLAEASVTLEGAREQVERIVWCGEGTPPQAPFIPRTKEVLELPLRGSIDLRRGHFGAEYQQLGGVRETEDFAASVLANLSVDPEAARRADPEVPVAKAFRP